MYRGNILIYRSAAGGATGTWEELSGGSWGTPQKVHQDTQAILVDPVARDTFYVGCDGGVWKVWKTADTAAPWGYANLNGDLNLTQFYGIATHPATDDILLGGAQDNSCLRRTACDTWDLAKMTGDGMLCAVNPAEPQYAYVEGYPDFYYGSKIPWIYRSDTGVEGSYHLITGNLADPESMGWVVPYTLDPRNPSQLFLGMNKIYVSQDRGDTWATTSSSLGGNVRCISASRVPGGPVYAGVGGKVWVSPNGLFDWHELAAGLPGTLVTDVQGDPSDASRALCVMGGFMDAPATQLYEYTAAAGRWVARGAGLPYAPANVLYMRSSTEVYVGTDAGVYKSTDGGATFTVFSNGLPLGVPVLDLKYNEATHTLTAGTYGRGAWQVSLGAPGESSNAPWSVLKWTENGRDQLTWGATFGAEGYRIYRGEASELANLPTGASVCRVHEGPAPPTGHTVTAVPPAGSFYWYLVTAHNAHGEGSAGSGTSTARVLHSTGACTEP